MHVCMRHFWTMGDWIQVPGFPPQDHINLSGIYPDLVTYSGYIPCTRGRRVTPCTQQAAYCAWLPDPQRGNMAKRLSRAYITYILYNLALDLGHASTRPRGHAVPAFVVELLARSPW